MLIRMPTPGIARIAPPRSESTVRMGRLRRIGIAEYGDPDGRLVLWCHGTPGARRQITLAGRTAAADLGIRLVCVERPGTGSSTPYRYRQVGDFAADAARVADHLGHERFGVVGLSGGGPYALACSARLGDRVSAVAVLGGVCPVVGPDAVSGGLIPLAARFNPLLQVLRLPIGLGLQAVLVPVVPFGRYLYGQFTRFVPEGDRAVLSHDEVRSIFVDDLVEALSRHGVGAVGHDIALFGADWGFRMAEVNARVRWWHGDADYLVPLAHAEQTCLRIPDVELFVRPGESHLGGFAAADEVLKTLSDLL